MSGTNRWAISALSKVNKAFAVNEEILIDKNTGEILIRTPDGNIISYDSLARFKAHKEYLILHAENLRVTGSLGNIKSDTIEFPDIVGDAVNIIGATPLVIKASGINKILISVDIDCIEILALDSLVVLDEPSISIDFVFTKSSNPDKNLNITSSISQLDKSLIDPNVLLGITDLSTYSASISSISVVANVANSAKVIRNIIHSILIIC